MERRKFIGQVSLLSSAIISTSTMSLASNFVDWENRRNGKSIIMICLRGGNDSYNTVVPYKNESYYSLRPSLAIPQNEILPLDHNYGFNPVLADLYSYHQAGYMQVFTQVNPFGSTAVYSHYEAQDKWDQLLSVLSHRFHFSNSPILPEFLDNYLNDRLIESLNQIVKAIEMQEAARVMYPIVLDGFDTHAFQREKHDLLLRKYAFVVNELVTKLDANGNFDNTLILTYSEMGRSIGENKRRGTDHGQSSCLLTLSGRKGKYKVNDDPVDASYVMNAAVQQFLI